MGMGIESVPYREQPIVLFPFRVYVGLRSERNYEF